MLETSFLNVVGLWAKSFQRIWQNCINCPEERHFTSLENSYFSFRCHALGEQSLALSQAKMADCKISSLRLQWGTCWGKNCLVEKVYKSSSVLESEQTKTRQMCQKCIFGVHSNILKKKIVFFNQELLITVSRLEWKTLRQVVEPAS